MNQSLVVKCAVSAVCLSLAFTSAHALSMLPPSDSPEYTRWQNNLNFYKYWRCSTFPEGFRTNTSYLATMKVRIAKSGLITHLSIINSSGDLQGDFSCLESIASAAPFEPMPKTLGAFSLHPPGYPKAEWSETTRYQGQIGFSTTQNPKPLTEGNEFFSKHPNLKGWCYLMHLVPLGINEHYTDLFTDAELTSAENLVAVKNNVEPDEAIFPFVESWLAFISTHKTATKRQILEEAARIRKKNYQLIAEE